ncbi:MAG: phenylalanine--tRNA ligase subunit beta, partial [Rubrivirga sp.]
EHTSLVIGIGGSAPAGWDASPRALDFYDLKGVVLNVLSDLGIGDVSEAPRPAPDGLTAYALDIEVGGTRLGSIGLLSEETAKAADLQDALFVAELDWDAIADLADRDAPPAYQAISRFPVAERDLALVVPESDPAGPLLETILEAGKPLLQDASLFDLYRGDRIPEGTKSLAFALRFGADRTLRDKEVDGRVKRIVKALEARHGATLRT